MTACFSVARALIRSAVVSIVHLLLNSRPRIGWHDISPGGKDAPELFLDQIDNRGTLAEAVLRSHSLQHVHVPIGGRECPHFPLTHLAPSWVPMYKNYIKLVWFLIIRYVSWMSRSLLASMKAKGVAVSSSSAAYSLVPMSTGW